METPGPFATPWRLVASVGVVIATVGRRETVEETLQSLSRRRTQPLEVVVVGAQSSDLPCSATPPPFGLKCVISPAKGLPIQRNYGVEHLSPVVEYVVFLDDDMEVNDDFFAEVAQVFDSHPQAAGYSGCVLANGINRGGARALLDGHVLAEGMPGFEVHGNGWHGLYGCNMNVRRRWLAVEKFDEVLPLYALGEDCEYGFRLARHGKVGGSARCRVAHLATRTGRISEVGVGYAQIINYLYFVGKDVGFPRWATWWERLVGLPASNLRHYLFPGGDRRGGAAIDRKGRLRGNLLAWRDVLRGQIDPRNLLRITGTPTPEPSPGQVKESPAV
jgi:GT2 family glycosyltransferase